MSILPLARRRTVGSAAVVALSAGIAIAGGAGAASTAPAPCTKRVLVLGAMPSEIGAVLSSTKVEETVTVDGRRFYVGKLKGNNVVLAMTAIGLVNAEQTATAAFNHFRCGSAPGISAAVFTGVSGGVAKIGDVTVVDRWRSKDTEPWLPVDATMQAIARKAAATVKLIRRTPTGDPACACLFGPNRVNTVDLGREPRVIFGGNGGSADPFNGEQFFCVPNGGNVFGCEPCRDQQRNASDVSVFVKHLRPFLGPDFFTSYFQPTTPSTTKYAAGDMETAAVAKVAKKNKTPFLAFRALSDGDGDPLHLATGVSGPLPGWLVQFAYYQQLAAENAGRMTLAFLTLWAHH